MKALMTEGIASRTAIGGATVDAEPSGRKGCDFSNSLSCHLSDLDPR